MKTALNFLNGSRRLVGQLTRPDKGEGPFPLMIYGHGYGYTFPLFDFELLAKRGIATYSFDFGGGAFDSQSDGSSLDMSVMTEAEEMSTVLNQLVKRPELDSSRVILCGHSQGGYAATVAGIHSQAMIKGMVLLSPAYIISTYAKHYFAKPDRPKQFRFINMSVSQKYFTDLRYYHPYAEMKKFDKPVVIVHGDADGMVPLSYSQRAAASFPHGHLIVAHGASHMLEGYISTIIDQISQMVK